MQTSIYFVIPDVKSFYSGGNLYNKELINGLIAIGFTPHVLNNKEYQNHFIDPKGHYFFDTLYLPNIIYSLKQSNKPAKYYLIVHHLESLYPPKGMTSRELFLEKEYPILQNFHGFLTSSNFTAAYLTKNGITQSKIVITPALTLPIENISKKAPTPLNALMIANLVERKGILPFLEKLNKNPLTITHNPPKINLIGSKEMEANYAKECLILIQNTPYLQKIINYQGALHSRALIPYYQKTNLFISCSFMETYGMALQEAVAYQLPILALDKGNVKEHVPSKEKGFLVDNINELVVQFNLLVEQPDILNKVLDNTSQRPKGRNYNWKMAAENFIKQLI